MKEKGDDESNTVHLPMDNEKVQDDDLMKDNGLSSVTFKLFKLVNADSKMDFLDVTLWVAMPYLRQLKWQNSFPQRSLIQEKDTGTRY